MSINGNIPKLWYRLISWLLSTSIFATACALALTLATERLLQGRLLPAFSPLHLLVAGCTLAEYNVHYLLNVERPDKSASNPYPQWWHPALCVIGVILCAVALPSLNPKLIIWLIILGVAALLYSIPSLPLRPKRKVNDYGLTKTLVLTTTWVAVTTIFPALFLHAPWNAAGAELLIRVLLIFPLCLAFDQRDVIKDRQAGIQTLAVTLGMRGSYSLMCSTLILLLLWAGFAFAVPVLQLARPFAVMVVSVVSLAVIRHSQHHQHPFIYSGLIDGMMLLYGLLIIWT